MKAFEHTPYEIQIKWTDIAKALGSWVVDTIMPNDAGYRSNHNFPNNHRIPFEEEVEVLPPSFHQVDTFQRELPPVDEYGFPYHWKGE